MAAGKNEKNKGCGVWKDLQRVCDRICLASLPYPSSSFKLLFCCGMQPSAQSYIAKLSHGTLSIPKPHCSNTLDILLTVYILGNIEVKK